jgi:hypothetical protein
VDINSIVDPLIWPFLCEGDENMVQYFLDMCQEISSIRRIHLDGMPLTMSKVAAWQLKWERNLKREADIAELDKVKHGDHRKNRLSLAVLKNDGHKAKRTFGTGSRSGLSLSSVIDYEKGGGITYKRHSRRGPPHDFKPAFSLCVSSAFDVLQICRWDGANVDAVRELFGREKRQFTLMEDCVCTVDSILIGAKPTNPQAHSGQVPIIVAGEMTETLPWTHRPEDGEIKVQRVQIICLTPKGEMTPPLIAEKRQGLEELVGVTTVSKTFSGAPVHSDTLAVFEAVVPQLELVVTKVEKILDDADQDYPTKVEVAGHGWGGGLSNLVAFFFAARLGKRLGSVKTKACCGLIETRQLTLSHYSFSSPAVFGRKMTRLFKSRVPNSYRFISVKDAYPCDYKQREEGVGEVYHVGIPVLIDASLCATPCVHPDLIVDRE